MWLEMGGWKGDDMFSRAWCTVAKQNLRAVIAQQFVERMDEAALAVEVEAQRTQFAWQT